MLFLTNPTPDLDNEFSGFTIYTDGASLGFETKRFYFQLNTAAIFR